jgi:hypothetical protein
MSVLEPKAVLRILRGGRAPLPWTWEIHQEGQPSASRRSARGYRSAEEAWEAGREALRGLGLRAQTSDPFP